MKETSLSVIRDMSIQITFERGNEDFVDRFATILRARGFKTSKWPNIQSIDSIYGVPLESLEGNVSVLPAPGEEEIGKKIAALLKQESGILRH